MIQIVGQEETQIDVPCELMIAGLLLFLLVMVLRFVVYELIQLLLTNLLRFLQIFTRLLFPVSPLSQRHLLKMSKLQPRKKSFKKKAYGLQT